MKFRKTFSKKQKHSRQVVKGGTARLVSPVKIAAQQAANNGRAMDNGILRPHINVQAPEALIEASGDKSRGILPGPFMLTITALAIGFIAVIAWFVSKMPDK